MKRGATLDPLGVVEFTVPGEPKPKGRPRFGRGRAYTPDATRRAEEAIRWEAIVAMHRRLIIRGPVTVTLRFYLSTARRVDSDNLAKLATDAMNTIVYADDSQITSLHIDKRVDRERPRTEITVRPIGEALAA